MSKSINKQQLSIPRLSHLDMVAKALEQPGFAGGLLNFWGSKGCGKTTFLKAVREKFSSSQEAKVTFWDAGDYKAATLSRAISDAIAGQDSKHKMVLIDNLDVFLKSDESDFFEFESRTILNLLDRGDTLIAATSRIEINFWQEYDVREQHKNHQLTPLKMDELDQIASETEFDSNTVYQMTFGHPAMLAALFSHPNWTEKEISDHAQEYFLEDLPAETRDLARTASLLPMFNIYLLREIQKDREGGQMGQDDLLTWYNERINELIRQWIVQFDTQMGSYRFTDHAVRRLIAKDFALNRIREFRHIQKIAADYYQEEAKGISYLPQIFVSAIYHLAQTQKALTQEDRGDYCLRWMKDMRNIWRGARWEQVLRNWENGAGDSSLVEELGSLIGQKYYSRITKILQENMDTSEA